MRHKWAIRSRTFVCIRLIVGAAALVALGGSFAATGSGERLPSRSEACRQTKQTVRGLQREFGKKAPPKAALDKMTRDICARGFTPAPGQAIGDR